MRNGEGGSAARQDGFTYAGVMVLIVVMGIPAGDALLWAVPSAHVAAGALLLACSVLLSACAYHMIRPADALQDAPRAGAAVPA